MDESDLIGQVRAKISSAVAIWDGEQYTGQDLEDIYTLIKQANELIKEKV